MKAGTNQKRADATKLALDEINKLRQKGVVEDLDQVRKLKAKCTYPREDVLLCFIRCCALAGVPYYCAPSETDFQCAHDEIAGNTDATYSEDSDFLPLGSKCLITKLKANGDCVIFYGDKVIEAMHHQILPSFSAKGDHLSEWTRSDMIVFCIMLGCDYLDNPPNQGLVGSLQFMIAWKNATLDAQKQLLNNIEMLGVAIPSPAQRKLWNKGKAVCVKGVKDYQVTFWRVFNLFSEPPVFKFVGGVANITTETISVGFASSDRTSGPAENFRLLGFDPFEGVTADNIVGCAKLEIYIRTNKPLVDILQKFFPDGVKYPCGWDLDFDKVPFSMQPIAALVRYLWCRAIKTPTSFSTKYIYRSIQSMLAMPCKGESRVVRPAADASDGSHYIAEV
jgi:hypothetical protein